MCVPQRCLGRDYFPRSRFVGIIPSIKVFFVKYNGTIKFRQNSGKMRGATITAVKYLLFFFNLIFAVSLLVVVF